MGGVHSLKRNKGRGGWRLSVKAGRNVLLSVKRRGDYVCIIGVKEATHFLAIPS